MSFLRRRDQERKPLADAKRAAGDESPQLREAGAFDFGSGSARIDRAREAEDGILMDRGKKQTKCQHIGYGT